MTERIRGDGRMDPTAEQRPLVIGASGFIGHVLWRRLRGSERLGTYCRHRRDELTQLDVRNEAATLQLVRTYRPTIIYMPAAMPSADACEAEPQLCASITTGGAAAAARAAREVGAQFVYFSTDYVFDGEAGPYAEDDVPRPINEYGRAKLAAEEQVRQTLETSLVVRLSGVYGVELGGKNFVMSLIERLSRGTAVRVPHDQVGTPTYVEDLVDAVIELARMGERGTVHVSGPEPMDRYTFSRLIADVFGLDPALVVPVLTSELGQTAPRPLNAGLRTGKAQRCLGRALRSPEAGLRAMQPELVNVGMKGAE